MSDENQHMDDSFRKMSEDLNASYDKSFWQDAKADLEDDALDSAFVNAANQPGTTAGMALAAEALGDAFMDDAFQDAAAQLRANYSSAYWEEMQANQPDLEMDEAFFGASKHIKASYNPVYWGAANTVLEQEGLHYEYDAAYWNEAKSLLDNADRRVFFTKWTGLAAVLLLISLVGIYAGNQIEIPSGTKMANELSQLAENRMSLLAERQMNHSNVVTENEEQAMDELSAMHSINHLENEGENGVANYLQSQLGSELADDYDSNEDNNSEVVNTDHFETNNTDNRSVNDLENNENGDESAIANGDQLLMNTYNPLDDNQVNHDNNTRALQNPVNNWEVADNNNHEKLAYKNEDIQKLIGPSLFNSIKPGYKMPETALVEIMPFKKQRYHTFSILAGAGKGVGYGINDMKLTNRIYGGLAYDSRGFGKMKKFEIGANILLNYSDHLDLKNETTSDSFKTDGTTQRYFVKYAVYELYYLNCNLTASYEFLPKHKLLFGIGMSTVIGAQSNLATNVRGGGDSGQDFIYLGKNLDIINRNNEIPTGIRRFDVGLNLGYDFAINKKLSIQLMGSFGLFDRTNDDYFQNQNLSNAYQSIRDNEMNLTVGLKYNLFSTIK